jgi:hypothetical protein
MEYENQQKRAFAKIWISIAKASKYSHISSTVFFQTLLSGKLEFRSTLSLDEISKAKRKDYTMLSSKVMIPVDELPPYAYDEYMLKEYVSNHIFDLPLTTFLDEYSFADLKDLLKEIQMLWDINGIGSEVFTIDRKGELQKKLKENDIRQDEYYAMKKEFKRLVNLKKLHRHDHICPAAEDFILDHYLQKIPDTKETIASDLMDQQVLCGSEICNKCPHNPSTAQYEKAVHDFEEKGYPCSVKKCLSPGNGMIVPKNRSTVVRYLQEVPPSVAYFAQAPKKSEWIAKYGSKLTRTTAGLKVNDLFFADNHLVKLYVITGHKPDGTPILKQPWLTAMVDQASGVIVSCIVSLNPNANIIGECLAYACAITYQSPVCGLPKVLYTDNGKDFCSEFMTDYLLPALNITHRKAKPYWPWTKPIERVFRTIEQKYIRKMPGWCGKGKIDNFLACPENKLAQLVEKKNLMTVAQFSEYIQSYVIPRYNNHRVRKHHSPMERYLSLPKAETLVPSWNSMSVLLQKPKAYPIYPEGIKYQGHYYTSLTILKWVGKKALVRDFGTPFTDCISVSYKDGNNGKVEYLGLAYRKDEVSYLEQNKLKLSRNLILLNLQNSQINSFIQPIYDLANLSGTHIAEYYRYDPITNSRLPLCYAPKPVTNPPIKYHVQEISTSLVHEYIQQNEAIINSLRKWLTENEKRLSLEK